MTSEDVLTVLGWFTITIGFCAWAHWPTISDNIRRKKEHHHASEGDTDDRG